MKKAASIIAGLVLLSLSYIGCSSFISKEPNLLIKGTVTDKISGMPIAGATVSDGTYGLGPPKYAITDKRGSYRYMTWYEEHTISARAEGYNSENLVLKTRLFSKETAMTIDFQLTPID